jgi:hypothetical protein
VNYIASQIAKRILIRPGRFNAHNDVDVMWLSRCGSEDAAARRARGVSSSSQRWCAKSECAGADFCPCALGTLQISQGQVGMHTCRLSVVLAFNHKLPALAASWLGWHAGVACGIATDVKHQSSSGRPAIKRQSKAMHVADLGGIFPEVQP